MNQPKKEYTLEENVTSLVFRSKDIIKELQAIREALEALKAKDEF